MAEPIAPAYPVPQTGVAPASARSSAPVQQNKPAADLETAYKVASQTANADALDLVAQQAENTEIKQEAELASQVIRKNQDEFDKITAPIAKAGGPDTAQGRLAAVEQWDTYGNDPKFGTWLVKYLMKDPTARVYAGFGNIKKTYEYGKNGDLLEVSKNELGNITNVLNAKTNQPVTKSEYAELQAAEGVGKVLTEEREKIKNKFNAEARNAEDAQVNAYAAFAPKMKAVGQDVYALGDALVKSGVKQGDIAKLVSFGNQTLSASQSQASLKSKLISEGKAAAASNDIEAVQRIAGQLGIPDVASVKSDGTLVRKNGQTVSLNSLDQGTTQDTASKAFENASSGNQEQRAMGELFSKLTPQQQQAVLRMVDLQSNLTNDYNKIRSEVGDLRFLVNLNDFSPLRGFGATMAKAESMIHNADMIKNYAEHRKNQLKFFDSKGQNPSAGEMQAAFTRTAGYQAVADDLQKRINSHLDFDLENSAKESNAVSAAATLKPANKGPVAPKIDKPAPVSRFSRFLKKD